MRERQNRKSLTRYLPWWDGCFTENQTGQLTFDPVGITKIMHLIMTLDSTQGNGSYPIDHVSTCSNNSTPRRVNGSMSDDNVMKFEIRSEYNCDVSNTYES